VTRSDTRQQRTISAMAFWGLLSLVGALPVWAQDSSGPAQQSLSVPALVQQCQPSIVLVRVLDSKEQLVSSGSGFVVAPGLVATCYHVVAGGAAATVKTADRIEYPVAEVAAANRALDLAILRVAKLDAPALALRDLSQIQTGEQAIAMGSPLGLEGTVTTGVVSAVREMGDWGTVIQTSAPISGGNSGGPLLDAQGRVMGLVQFTLLKGQNLNFAIPATQLGKLLQQVGSGSQAEGGSGLAVPGVAAELLKPVGTLGPRTGALKLRVPSKEPFSVGVPAYFDYTADSLEVSIDGKRLERVQKQDDVAPGRFWVSDLGSVWVDKTYARKDAQISFEYRPFRVAVQSVADVSGGDLADVLVERVKAMGCEAVTGADVIAAVAKATASQEKEEALRQVGRQLNCAYLVAGTLESARYARTQYRDSVTIRVGLVVVDLNTGRVVLSQTRDDSYTIGRLHSGNDDRKDAAARVVDGILAQLALQ
jgi:S1-C subfamily serine protease/TolB-like protein